MKKIIWIPLLIIALGVVLALVGCAAGGMQSFRIDRGGIHPASTERGKLVKVDESYQDFTNIDVNADFIDRVVLKEGDGFTVKGQNYESYGGLDVKLDGNTLKVDARDKRGWHINLGIGEFFNGAGNDTWLEITYPKGTSFSSVSVNISSTNISVNGLDCEELFLDVAFGDIDASAIKCGNLHFDADSGRINLTDAEVNGKAVIIDSFGDVELVNIRADSLNTDLDSGKIRITNALAGSFTVTSDFGRVEIDEAEADSMALKLNSGDLVVKNTKARDLNVDCDFGSTSLNRLYFTGLCDIKSSSGDVDLGLLMSEDDLSYELSVDAGSVSVGDRKSGGSVSSRASGATANLRVECSFGDIKLKFIG